MHFTILREKTSYCIQNATCGVVCYIMDIFDYSTSTFTSLQNSISHPFTLSHRHHHIHHPHYPYSHLMILWLDFDLTLRSCAALIYVKRSPSSVQWYFILLAWRWCWCAELGLGYYVLGLRTALAYVHFEVDGVCLSIIIFMHTKLLNL